MQINKSILVAVAISAGIGMQPASGQLPVSRPGGAIQQVIKGGNKFSGVGVPFTREPVAREVVDSVSGNTINVTGAPFTAGAFSSLPHTLVIATGPNRGRAIPITSNTTSSVTVSSAPPALVDDSDEFQVIPDWTLGNLFGTGANPSGLASNASSGVADLVYVANGLGSVPQYFHNGTSWRQVGGGVTNRNNVSLGLNGGGLVLKRSTGDVNFLVKGVLRSGRQNVTVVPGFNTATFTDMTSVTLGTSGLVPGVLVGNASSGVADIVYIANAAGTLVQYFHNGSQWRIVGGGITNQNGVAIKPEAAILINKRSAGTSQWLITETFVP